MNRLIRKIKLRYTTQVLLLFLEKEVISRVVYRDEDRFASLIFSTYKLHFRLLWVLKS